MKDLKGNIALVTGVGRKEGIGAAICRELATSGVDIFYTYWQQYDKNLHPADNYNPEDFAKELEQLGVRAAGGEVDLMNPEAPQVLFKMAAEKLGTPDILINNACYDVAVPLAELTQDVLDKHYFVNMRAPALLCVEFAKACSEQGGTIINMTSGQSLGSMSVDQISYTTTKAGTEMFVRQMYPELAKKKIDIFALDPGPTDTGWMTEEIRKYILRDSPKGGINTPADIAKLVVSILTEEKYASGEVIHANR